VILFIAALISVSLFLVVRNDSSQFQTCQAEYQTKAGGEQQPEGLSFFVQRVLAPHCTARFVEVHNAVITAIATVLLTIVTGGLVGANYLQVATTRAQLRAYVFPDSAGLVDGLMLNPPIQAKANEPGVILAQKNFGQTPAREVVSWGQLTVIEPINEHTLAIPTLQNVFSNHLGSGGIGAKKPVVWSRAYSKRDR
jgi:hypothetical protein